MCYKYDVHVNMSAYMHVGMIKRVPPYDRQLYDRQLHDRQIYDRQLHDRHFYVRQLHDRQYYDRQLHEHHRHDRQNYGKLIIHKKIFNFILY